MTATKILNAYDRLNALDSNDSRETILKAVDRAKEQIEDAGAELLELQGEMLVDSKKYILIKAEYLKQIADKIGAIHKTIV